MIRLLAAIFMMVAVIAPASAQVMISTGDDSAAAVALPDPLTPEAVREVVSQLSDADVRRLLLERLDAVAEAEAQDEADASGGLADFADKATFGVLHSISDAVGKTPLLLQYQVKSFNNFFDRLGTQGIVFLLIVFGAALSVGLAVERLFLYLTRRWHKTAPPARRERTLRETVSFLFRRLCADVLGLVVFFFAVSTIGPIIGLNLAQFILDEPARILPMISQYIGGIWVSLIVLPRIAAALGRFFLAPGRPDDRLLHIDEASARFIFVHQIGFFFLVGFSYWIFQFNDINGVAMGESRLGFWLNIAIHSYLAWLIWTVRDGMTMMLRGPSSEVTATEEKAAQIYPLFIVGVSIGTWYLVEILVVYELWELIASAPHVKMMLLLAFAPTMDTLVRGLVRHVTPPMTGEGVVAEAAYKATKRSYIRIGRIIAFAVVVLTIGQIWGIDFKNLAAAGVGAQVAGRGLEILMIIAFGYLVWELVSLWINRKLAAEQTAAGFDLTEDEPGGGEGGGAGGSRLSTVLPLVLGVMKAAIATIFGLIALGNIGIDITPLLAGAGIIGLAVGFGAQKLVADVVSGIFFLVDDAFRTGEYVEVEGTVGTVEKISIRSMQLRHHKGPVHTIPYGEIPKITNYSRDWVIMKLKFTIPFEADPNKVKKIFKQIGKDMMAVPEFAADMLQPFKSQGVFDFDDVGMIIRGKFMAKPGKQFTLRKEVYNRVKEAFAENGIDFARREVRVALPGVERPGELTEEDKAAIAAAAGEAARRQTEGGEPKG